MPRKILLTAASLFLVWQSVKLIGSLEDIHPEGWAGTLFLAWIVNLFITGIFAFTGFAWPTQRLLPGGYYRIHAPENLQSAYRILGVDIFRQLLLATLWKGKAQRARYFNGRRAGLEHLVTESKKSEFGHLLPLFVIAAVVVYMVVLGYTRLAVLTAGINLVGNLYPIVLQRHHRMRVARLSGRAGATKPAFR